jgi:hypothetical protein
MKAYFVRTAMDVFNAFNTFFEEDAVKAATTNTVEQNMQLSRTYADRTKIIMDARESAAELKENTDAYKTDTVNLIRRVKAERDIGLTRFSDGLAKADTDSAEALVQALPRLPTALQHTLQTVFFASAGPLSAAALGAAHDLVDEL